MLDFESTFSRSRRLRPAGGRAIRHCTLARRCQNMLDGLRQRLARRLEGLNPLQLSQVSRPAFKTSRPAGGRAIKHCALARRSRTEMHRVAACSRVWGSASLDSIREEYGPL